jgi:hypothetical protein
MERGAEGAREIREEASSLLVSRITRRCAALHPGYTQAIIR